VYRLVEVEKEIFAFLRKTSDIPVVEDALVSLAVMQDKGLKANTYDQAMKADGVRRKL